jgi:hypothetical protein
MGSRIIEGLLLPPCSRIHVQRYLDREFPEKPVWFNGMVGERYTQENVGGAAKIPGVVAYST